MEKVIFTKMDQGRNFDCNPVTLEDGTTVKAYVRENSEGLIVRASAMKGGREIGYGSWSTKNDIFSVRLDPISKSADAKGLARIIFEGIMQILDEGTEGMKVENTGE